MNQYVTGAVIRELREKNCMTQLELAEKLCVSDKTVSKWETGKGYPDISLLEPIAKLFHVSVTELISGNAAVNTNVSANMLRSKFYVCPICGNIIHSMGEAVFQCHGVQLFPQEGEQIDEKHRVLLKQVEDEYYVQIPHEMSKVHYISFIAALSPRGVQMVKLYPEENAEARFKISGVRRICFYCNQDGLFFMDPVKGTEEIKDSEKSREGDKESHQMNH